LPAGQDTPPLAHERPCRARGGGWQGHGELRARLRAAAPGQPRWLARRAAPGRTRPGLGGEGWEAGSLRMERDGKPRGEGDEEIR